MIKLSRTFDTGLRLNRKKTLVGTQCGFVQFTVYNCLLYNNNYNDTSNLYIAFQSSQRRFTYFPSKSFSSVPLFKSAINYACPPLLKFSLVQFRIVPFMLRCTCVMEVSFCNKSVITCSQSPLCLNGVKPTIQSSIPIQAALEQNTESPVVPGLLSSSHYSAQ